MATTLESRAAAPGNATPSGLRGIHHLALNTDDMKKTVEFYVGVLGMKLVHTLVTPAGGMDRAKVRGNPPFECIRHYFFDMGGDSLLAFFELPASLKQGDRNALGTMQHLAFAVSEERYDDMLARVKKAGIAIADGPLNAVPPDTWSFYFFDPNGIRLEVATDKGRHKPNDLDVVASCTQTPEEIRAELATLTDDRAWIERMVATVPKGR
jgi:catechol 2,3-dioxygenase-like lactoylglutathione lyase family enzyme